MRSPSFRWQRLTRARPRPSPETYGRVTFVAGDGGAPADGQPPPGGAGSMATTPTDVHVPAGAPALQDGAVAPGSTADGAPTPQVGVVAPVAPPLAPPATSPRLAAIDAPEPPLYGRTQRLRQRQRDASAGSAQATSAPAPALNRPPDRRREWDRGGRAWNRRSCAPGPSARGQAQKDPQAPGSRSRRLPRRWLRARPASDRSRCPRLPPGGRGGSAPNCDGTDAREVARLARAAADPLIRCPREYPLQPQQLGPPHW